MYIRKIKAGKFTYLQAMENKRVDGRSKSLFLWSLGRYDEKKLTLAREALKDWRKLKHSAEVIAELQDNTGPLQGKGYLKNFSRRI